MRSQLIKAKEANHDVKVYFLQKQLFNLLIKIFPESSSYWRLWHIETTPVIPERGIEGDRALLWI